MKAKKNFSGVALLAAILLVAGVIGWMTLKCFAPSLEPPKAKIGTASVRVRHAVASAKQRPDSIEQGQAVPKVGPISRPSKKGPALDPAARTALKLVGSDPEADQYWIGAINNPLLPPEERKDLIEDLNEEGFSDPRNPGANDLPLIATRIHLIEQLMPEPLDRVNAEAFQEAHKDLVKMYTKISGR